MKKILRKLQKRPHIKDKIIKSFKNKYIKLSKVLKFVNTFFAIIGFISSIITIVGLFNKSDDSIAVSNYNKGLNYLSDQYYEDAEKCFEKTYNINSNLFNIKYYYAYTEIMLKKFDKSYKILAENKDSLDENEMVLLSLYEYRKNNYDKSEKYMNKIQEPEKLNIFAFCEYIEFTTKLGFLENYNKGLNVIYNNLILLNTKIFEHKEIDIYPIKGFILEEDQLQQTENRVQKNLQKDNTKYIRIKLYMYLLFIYYSIEYENYEAPIYYFSDMAETLDYANHSDISRALLSVLYIYATELTISPNMPEEMKEAYNIVSKKYNELKLFEKEDGVEINQQDRELFEALENISKEINNNTFDPGKYSFTWQNGFKGSEDNILKEWKKNINNWIDW